MIKMSRADNSRVLSDNLIRGNRPHQDKIVFIHASDIHLGAAQYQNQHRANDFIRAFQNILNLALQHKVDFILLGGDIFTSLEMLPGNLLKVVNIFKNFKKFTQGTIPIITIEGNHDIRKFSRGVRFNRRGQSWLKFIASLGLIILLDADFEAPPEKIYLPYDFNINKGGKIRIKNVVIYGNRYLGENPEEYILNIKNGISKRPEDFCILLQHYGIEGQMKNVPGINYNKVQPLKEKVDYLALGHYHLQFSLGSWIFNPGSSEAACFIDSTFTRGIFIVEIKRKATQFIKRVRSVRLINRKHLWKTILFKNQLMTKEDVYDFIIKTLQASLAYLNFNIEPSNPEMPILYLILKGKKPFKFYKSYEKELGVLICETLPVVDVRIYQKFDNPFKTLDKYIKVQIF